jgi:NADH-quinone oxidoreductase subunit E
MQLDEAERHLRRPIRRELAGLMTALQGVQAEHGYLPRGDLQALSARFGLPVMQVYALATFYRAFHLEPRGRHTAKVCMGTACHVLGAPLLMEALSVRLGAPPGGTSPDRAFSLEAVRCVGACSMAPVIVIDEEVHGLVRQKDLRKILRKYKEK